MFFFSLAGLAKEIFSICLDDGIEKETIRLTFFSSINNQKKSHLKILIMAELKRRSLILSTGKQIKLFGSSIAIGKSLEIGEGYAPNIFSFTAESPEGKTGASVTNPHKFTPEEMMELADYNIQLWMDLKDNIRKHGLSSPKVFNQDALR